MKKRVLNLVILAILPLIFLGCGTFCGENPMGDIGGEGGYGILNPANNMSEHDNGENEIYGVWRHDYEPGEFDLLYIQQDGTFIYYEYYDYSLNDVFYGSYTYTSTHITLHVSGQGTQVCQYEFTGDTLTIHYNSGTVQYYRVTVP